MAASLSLYDRVLALRPDLRPVPLPPDRVMLVGERARHLLQGAGYPPLLAALDGRRTVRAVIDAAGVDGATALFLIGRLEAGGWLVDAERGPRTAFGQALGVEPGAAVAIESLDGAGALAAALADALRGFGLTFDPGAARVVVPVVDPLDPGLDALARRLRTAGRRWLPVVASGVRWWFGPAFAAGGGPCWQCLAARLRLNHPVRAWLRRLGRPDGVPRDAPPAALEAAFGLVAPAIARWAAGAAGHPLDGTLIEVDPIGLTLERHRVVRRPQCSACGDPGLMRARAERPLALRARPITADDGGYRAVAPAETWARLAHHVSPVTGVVARLWPIDARSHVGPVFGAVSPVCPADERPPAAGFRQLSMGKGRTAEQARVSALCEALERHVWRWQGDEPHRRATAGELGGSAVPPGSVQLFSAAQMAADGPPTAEVAPTRPRDAARVPRPYPPDAPLDWTPAWSLTHGRARLLPTAWCHAGAPRADDRRYVVTDSNGLAAGNCLEEAILQGFLELVERDAVGIWWYNRLRRPALDPAAFGDDWLSGCVTRLDGIGWDLWALDLTHDLGIPVCAALARARGGEPKSARWSVGFGCHLEARLALGRALTELGQQLDPSSGHRAPWSGLPSTDFLAPAPGPPRGPDAFESFEVRDLRAAVELCVARAAGAGLETLVVDLTRPDIALAVARVCVPGLRHFWPRFAPGRLYTVPVEMGWRAAPLAEDALNPAPLWL